MRAGSIAFLAGVAILQSSATLPDAAFAAYLPLCVLVAVLDARLRPVALLLAGFLWALWRAHLSLEILPGDLEGRDLVVTGTVAGLPDAGPRRLRFVLDPDAAAPTGERPVAREVPSRLLLSWYRAPAAPAPGERWRLRVRLKRRHGLMNPAGFDYETWLWRSGVVATGYVRDDPDNRRIEAAAGRWLDRARHRLSAAVRARLDGHAMAPMVTALALGDRRGLRPAQWEVLAATGTGHLMAISGLHVGLVATAAFLLASRLWRRLAWSAWPAACAGAAAAAVAAVGYAALAGFAIPTQRALVMLGVALAATLARRNVDPATGLAAALLGVLVLDPRAVISPGFWLSFAAVAIILYTFVGRPRPTRWWWALARLQLALWIGLAPVVMWVFGEQPIAAVPANLIAVPWVSLAVAPAAIVGAALAGVWPAAAALALHAAAQALALLWPLLEALAGLEIGLAPAGAPSRWALAAAAVGVAMLLLPRGVPGRWLGLAWLLPLLHAPGDAPPHGGFDATVLDVGQGLAVVVQTHRHLLVYDAGPAVGGGFDAGRTVVAPQLRHLGARRIDRLVISHGDSDHAGGAPAVLRALPVGAVLTNAPGWRGRARPCVAGHRWRWDGVEFAILHPSPGTRGSENDRSCVLRVAAGSRRLLLPGDIEHGAERALAGANGAALRADVLVLAHHGSRTSSTPVLLDAVAPGLAIASAGYRNRRGFPHRPVVARLRGRGIPLLVTAWHGAVTLRFRPGRAPEALAERESSRRYWHDPPPTAATRAGRPSTTAF